MTYAELKTDILSRPHVVAFATERLYEQQAEQNYELYEAKFIATNENGEHYVAAVKIVVKDNEAHIVRGFDIQDPTFRQTVITLLENALAANAQGLVGYNELSFLRDSAGATVLAYQTDNGNVTATRYFLYDDDGTIAFKPLI